jgi:hypothetical protein
MTQNVPYSTPVAPDSNRSVSDDLQRQVDAAAEYGLFSPIEVEALATAPFTISVSLRAGGNPNHLDPALGFIARKLVPIKAAPQDFLFRGVPLNRLGHVISNGCDVAPSTAPLFASDSAKKALEYGCVVLVFDPAKLEKTFKKVRKSESFSTLHQLREDYASEMEFENDWLWFSKLPPGDGRIGSLYEIEYSFFIPGNPHDALQMIFLIGEDPNALRAEFLRCTELSLRHPAPSSGR